jgi:hypothetical protein
MDTLPMLLCLLMLCFEKSYWNKNYFELHTHLISIIRGGRTSNTWSIACCAFVVRFFSKFVNKWKKIVKILIKTWSCQKWNKWVLQTQIEWLIEDVMESILKGNAHNLSTHNSGALGGATLEPGAISMPTT